MHVYRVKESELIFYDKERYNLDLQTTLDAGDKCDFVGIYNNQHARFDTTTNIDYKTIEGYDSFQRKNRPYYIVVYNRSEQTFNIIDINFPFCPECNGRLVDALILHGIRLDRATYYTGSAMQTLYQVCTCYPDIHCFEVKDFFYFIEPKKSIEDYLKQDYNDVWYEKEWQPSINKERKELLKNYRMSMKKFAQSLTNRPLGFIAEYDNHPYGPDAEENWYTEVIWCHEMLEEYFPTDLEINLML